MKKLLFVVIAVLLCIISFSQNKTFDVSQELILNWNTNNSIPYSQVPGANLAATSFTKYNDSIFVFLCNSSNEIIFVNSKTNKITERHAINASPRDFYYEQNSFYVLYENSVIMYDSNCEKVNEFIFPKKYLGTERITRYNNSTYLLLPTGSSYCIEENHEYEGWISKSGNFVELKFRSFMYNVTLLNLNISKTFNTEKKIAGIYLIDATFEKIILDIQYFNSENPVNVERNVVTISYNKTNINDSTALIKVPDVYYVLSNKDFILDNNNELFNLLSSPYNLYVFKLTETNKQINLNYPSILLKNKYHYNNNLIKGD